MSKSKLTPAEWELVKDAPYWVQAALAAADKKGTQRVVERETQALQEALKGYHGSNALIRDIVAEQGKPAATVGKASKSEADVALGRIASIVESKLGANDLDELNDLLLLVGRQVAGAAKESALGIGDAVSKREAEALKQLEVVLRATDEQKRARRQQAQAAQTTAATQARQEADARAEAARRDAEAKAKADREKQAADAKMKAEQEKAHAEAEAKKKQEQAANLAKAREEAEARQREALVQREAREREEKARTEAEARATEERARAEAEAKAAAEREAAAKQAAPRFTEFIAEHTVVAGDNLSRISEKYYGHQGNFRLIYEANREVIGDNMNLIRPGQKLRIPKL